jgi:hypothetical protein
MGWERRQQGGVYYYRSVRIHGLPRKAYYGAGEAGVAQAERDAEERGRRQAERQAILAERQRAAAADATLEEARSWADLLVAAVLVMDGYHHHRGQWRKWRGNATDGE